MIGGPNVESAILGSDSAAIDQGVATSSSGRKLDALLGRDADARDSHKGLSTKAIGDTAHREFAKCWAGNSRSIRIEAEDRDSIRGSFGNISTAYAHAIFARD